MRGTRFNDINDITVQVQQHKSYLMHKKRLEQIGNGQLPNQSTMSPHQSFILGSGNLTSPRMGALRGTGTHIQRQSYSKNWSPMETPRQGGVVIIDGKKEGGGNRKLNSSLEVNLGRSILNNQNNIRNAGIEIEQKYMSNKLSSIEYREIEKLNQIQRENEILLEKLISISKGQQLSVPNHMLTSSSRLIHNGSNLINQNLPTEGSQASPKSKHAPQTSQKKLKTLNMVAKKLEAQRIDQENLFLLSRITQVSSNLDKTKLDKEWSKQEQYRLRIQRANRKSDLEKLIMKRQGFIEKNYQVLPKIYPPQHQTSRSVLLREVPEDDQYDEINLLANPQAAATIEEYPGNNLTPIKPTKRPNFRSKTRLSMPHDPFKNLEPIKTSQLVALGGSDPRKSVDPTKPAYHLNLNVISSLDIKRLKVGKKESARHLNEYSKKDLFSNQQSARSISNTKRYQYHPTDSSVQEELDTKRLEEDETIVRGVIDQVQNFGIAEPIRPFMNNKATRKIGKDLNRTDQSYVKPTDEANKSKDVTVNHAFQNWVNQSNPTIIPITITHDGALGASNQTPVGHIDKSQIVSSMINKSSNTTLEAPMGGQQSQSKLYQNMRYHQIQSSPRQHATIMRIANKLLPTLSKTRFQNKISNSPSNNISLFESANKEDSTKGKSTQRESMNLIHLGKDVWKRDLQARTMLDQLSALPPYVFRKGEQLLMPASNILASIHLKDYKKSGKSPFGVKTSKYFTQKNTFRRKGELSPVAKLAHDEVLERALKEKDIGPMMNLKDGRNNNSSSYDEDGFEAEQQSPIGVNAGDDTGFQKK